MKFPTFKMGGIHPPQEKTAPADKIISVDLPLRVSLLLKQHGGAEAVPVVKKGDHVERGQKVAEAKGFISSPVHTPISGTVKEIAPVTTLQGRMAMAVVIEASAEDHQLDEAKRLIPSEVYDYSRLAPADIVGTVADAGVVGLGGATFPTAVKLSAPPGSKAQLLIINACECEPCLNCDDALMRAHPREIVKGIEIMMRAAGVDNAVIGIEDNKPQAYEAIKAACEEFNMRKAAEPQDKANTESNHLARITIRRLQSKYPQGCEKQLIYALTGCEVPSGSLPISVGAIVQNVGTAYAVYRAVALREPLTERVVTIAGIGNFMAHIGMRVCDLPVGEGCTVAQSADVIAGGPMMGLSCATLEAPVTKGLSGITVVSHPEAGFNPEPCIRCGKCAYACPMGLEPYLISTYGRTGHSAEAKESGAMDCIECGSCSYSCPSRRPVLDFIRLAKANIRKEKV